MMQIGATLITRHAVTIEWIVLDNLAQPVDTEWFEVWRGEPGGPMEHVATVRPERFTDTQLDASTTYRYMVQTTQLSPQESVQASVKTERELEYQTAMDFYLKFFAPTFRRDLTATGTRRWCPEWWRHPEAVLLVTELWNSYEDHRPPDPPKEPGSGRMEWLVYQCKVGLEWLLDPEGPFRGCDARLEHDNDKCQALPHIIDPSGGYGTDLPPPPLEIDS